MAAFFAISTILSVLSTIEFGFGFYLRDSAGYDNFVSKGGLPPSCQRLVYCESELMHDVQMAGIYRDSKTFVDKKLLYPEREILKKYAELKNGFGSADAAEIKARLTKFVNENFTDGDELEIWIPPDFTKRPGITDRIVDEEYKQWALALNEIWKSLARKIKDDVRKQPELYSLIHVPNGFCIPGGRFRELYYWDTYWIVNGLLLCDMVNTARGIIENIISLVRKFGFMPNGNRVYYLNRSQPPLLMLMVFNYHQKTNDFEFIRRYIEILTSEFEYWMTHKMVEFEKDGKTYRMGRYYAPSRGPRPESYREDYELAQGMPESERDDFYTNIKSGAETGWDFSSRWFVKDGTSGGSLKDIKTPVIIPVDLNSFLHVNALCLAVWWERMGDLKKSRYYRKIASDLLSGLQEVCWRDDKGAWFDYDILNKKHREEFYVSNIVPMWTGGYEMKKSYVASKVLTYLKDEKIIESDYSIKYNGTPTSLQATREQWDFPNAWPPLQAFIIQGLDRTNDRIAQTVAFRLAQVWLHSNHKGFKEFQVMFEKYDVLNPGTTGVGGEYEPQTGFGWTNGVVLEFLDRYGKYATPYDTDLTNNSPSKPLQSTLNKSRCTVTESVMLENVNTGQQHIVRCSS